MGDGSNFGQNQSDNTVLLHITHSNLKQRWPEIRLDRHTTITNLKTKLCTHCGTNPEDMLLYLMDEAGNMLATMEDGQVLGFYSPVDFQVIHIFDMNPHSTVTTAALEDTSSVKKYVMSEEDYNNRDGMTYRKFK